MNGVYKGLVRASAMHNIVLIVQCQLCTHKYQSSFNGPNPPDYVSFEDNRPAPLKATSVKAGIGSAPNPAPTSAGAIATIAVVLAAVAIPLIPMMMMTGNKVGLGPDADPSDPESA